MSDAKDCESLRQNRGQQIPSRELTLRAGRIYRWQSPGLRNYARWSRPAPTGCAAAPRRFCAVPYVCCYERQELLDG